MAKKKVSKGEQQEKPTPKPSEPKEPRVGKLYIRRDSAQRAAREDGLAPGDYHIEEEKGQFRYVYSDSYRSMKGQIDEKKSPEPLSEEDKIDQAIDLADKDIEPKRNGNHVLPPPEKPLPTHEEQVKDKVAPQVLPELAPKVVEVKQITSDAARVTVTPPKVLTPEQQLKKDLEEAARAQGKEPGKLIIVDETTKPKEAPVPVAPGQPPITTGGKPSGLTYSCPDCKPPQSFPNKPALLKHRTDVHGYKPKGKEGWLHRSEVESPTKAVWAIADEMKEANPNITRKEVIAECERRGIAHWTARTQYQAWLTATRESDANAAKVNGNHKNGKK